MESSLTAVITCKDLHKTYGEGDAEVKALRGINLEIPAGEVVVILGQSGSGKTTLLNQIGALEEPTSGEVIANDTALSGLDESGRTAYRLDSIGFIFQLYNLVPTLTARENIGLIAELTGDNVDERCDRVLEQVVLSGRDSHFPAQMSGGEQQRVSIARGLVKDPPIVLADEPTGALDTETGTQILKLLRGLVESGERTVLVVTHNREIARIAHRVIELRDGEIMEVREQQDPPDPADLEW